MVHRAWTLSGAHLRNSGFQFSGTAIRHLSFGTSSSLKVLKAGYSVQVGSQSLAD
jgi:hypothetical protein